MAEVKDKCKCHEEETCKCEKGKCECVDCKCDETCDCKSVKKHEHKDKNKELLKEACEKIQTLQEDLLRNKAELVNYRKRKDDEVSKMLLYCNEDLVKEILPVLDNFERAIKYDSDNLDESLSKFLEGFKMIYCNMVGILNKYGVKAIDGSNKPFDPTYHQAVLMEHRDDVEPGMVLEVLQKGYLLKDKVIRPAMVRVSE